MGTTSALFAKMRLFALDSSLSSFLYLKNKKVHDKFLIMQTRVTP